MKEHKLIAPGQPGAPSNMAGAVWKLAKEMFPDVSVRKAASSLARPIRSPDFPVAGHFIIVRQQQPFIVSTALAVPPHLLPRRYRECLFRREQPFPVPRYGPFQSTRRQEAKRQEAKGMVQTAGARPDREPCRQFGRNGGNLRTVSSGLGRRGAPLRGSLTWLFIRAARWRGDSRP